MTPYIEHYKALIRIGLPIVIGQLGIIILGFADTFMIGWHSTDELAAAGFVNNMFGLAIITSTGFTYGLTPIIGALFGRGDRQACGVALRNSLYANTLMAAVVCGILALLYFNLENLGQPEHLLPLMRSYFLILMASMPFVLWFNGLKQFTDGITDTHISMWLLIGGNALNIVGNYLLIYGKGGLPEMGLTGAGISTLVSRIVMVVAYVVIFTGKKKYHTYLEACKKSRFDKSMFVRLHQLGLPIALQMGMETASFSLSTVMVGWLGATQLAAHQVMLTVSQLCFMMYYGMGAAVSVRVSNFMGTKDVRSADYTVTAGFHLILLMLCMSCTPILLLRTHIGGWFTDDVAVMQMVAGMVIPFIIYQVGDGLQINYANALRGIADVKWMMVYAFIAYFVISLPAGYFFGFVLNGGITGIWMAFPFGLTSAGVMYYLRYRYTMRRQSAFLTNHEPK